MFIMIDGIDGSGKSTVIEAIKNYLIKEGNAIFDLKKYWQKTNTHPKFIELKKYDFIFSYEPTYVGMGKKIREKLINQSAPSDPKTIAKAFAKDRQILYQNLLIPALKESKLVIQDRGVSTSLCYQPLTNPEITVEYLLNLAGNKQALHYRPDHLLLLSLPAQAALKRLSKRVEKQDQAIFEQLDFQLKAADRFASPVYQNIFTSRGTKIHLLPANTEIDIMSVAAITLFKSIVN